MGRPPMGWAPAVFGRFLKPGGLGGRPKLALALPTIPLVKMKTVYARALYRADDATLDDLREAVTTIEEAGRTARRVFGSSHPTTEWIEHQLRNARAALRAREASTGSA